MTAMQCQQEAISPAVYSWCALCSVMDIVKCVNRLVHACALLVFTLRLHVRLG